LDLAWTSFQHYLLKMAVLQNPKQLVRPNSEHWKIKSWVQIFIFKPQNYTIIVALWKFA